MAFVIQTTQELFDNALAYIESRINQTTPSADKAFNRVMSALLSMMLSILLKFATDRAKECLTISASIDGLRVIGQGRNIPEKEAESTVLIFTVPGVNGTIIETSVIYVADSTGVRYTPDASATIAGGIATITATAQTPGVVGNLANGLTLKADRQVSGAEQTGTVTSTVTTGADAEDPEEYRRRLLADERTEGGGGNSADNRRNSELTPGVNRGYPYSGNPTFLQTGAGAILPGERTIFIKADTSIDPDGVPTPALLITAEAYIKTDQETGLANEPLGCDGDADRYVVAIYNTVFYVVISGLDVSIDLEAQVKSDIEAALKVYFRTVEAYIAGLDFIGDKNDTISLGSVSGVVNDVVAASGGSFNTLSFNVGAGALTTPYTPDAGELTKLADTGGVSYV